MNTILVVDDEEKLVEVIQAYLEQAGYRVAVAYDGLSALRQFERTVPDLVLLDLMLPGLSGEDVCRAIRKKSRVPILMLSAKVDEASIVDGLGIGADDYVTKPFSSRQLLARIAVLLRRSTEEAIPLSDRLSFHDGDLVIDNLRREIRKNGRIVPLTPNEYRILMTLAKYPAKTFTREELIRFAFGEDYPGFDRAVDSHVKNLRQKIEDDPRRPQYILTAHGIGYKFGGDRT